jgi:hypothetical protein
MKTNISFGHILLSSPYNEKCFRKKVEQKINTLILCSIIFFFSKIVSFMGYGTAGQATIGKTVRCTCRFAHWMTEAKYTHSEYAIIFFLTATVVTRTRLDITFCVHYLPCYSRFSASNDAVLAKYYHPLSQSYMKSIYFALKRRISIRFVYM